MTPTQADRDLLVLISQLQKSAHAPIDDRYMEAVSAIASFRLAAEAAAFEKAAGVAESEANRNMTTYNEHERPDHNRSAAWNQATASNRIATAIRKLAGEKHDRRAGGGCTLSHDKLPVGACQP